MNLSQHLHTLNSTLTDKLATAAYGLYCSIWFYLQVNKLSLQILVPSI